MSFFEVFSFLWTKITEMRDFPNVFLTIVKSGYAKTAIFQRSFNLCFIKDIAKSRISVNLGQKNIILPIFYCEVLIRQ